MKNLPEKIYLNLNMTPQEVVETKDKDFHEATKTWEITWSEESLSEHDPEYIRKDAFIKKTADYIKKDMLDNLAFQGRLNRIEIIDGIIDKFIKAMKGE